METILELLKAQVPFLIALTICVFCNTLCGAFKHEKLSDFNWKELLIGFIRFIGITLVILLMVIAIQIYEPLYNVVSEDFETLKKAIVIAYALKVISQIKEYYSITDDDLKKVKETHKEEVEDDEELG